MKSIKTILLGTTLAAGVVFFMGATDVHADSVYTIKKGDTLSAISYKIKGDHSLIASIVKANGLADANMIFEGEKLTIPTQDGNVPVQATAPVQATPVQAAAPSQAAAPVVESAPAAPAAPQAPANSSSAKEWIAEKESNGSYSATNGRYIGRYQLDASYLNGDYSPENQERVADSYVAGRYGSWEAAQAFWLANGWY